MTIDELEKIEAEEDKNFSMRTARAPVSFIANGTPYVTLDDFKSHPRFTLCTEEKYEKCLQLLKAMNNNHGYTYHIEIAELLQELGE